MRSRSLLAAVLVMAAANFASADTIHGINIDFVNIGHAGNAADTGGTPGRGAVGYNYRIGTYDITNAQWYAFTAAAGTPTGTDAGYSYPAYWTDAQQPTNMVSWYEAAQFCNYLTSGNKSKGAYLFSGDNANPGGFLGVNRTAAQMTYGTIYVIPTEDEWYKAAYYKPDGSGYSLYANGTDTAPVAGVQSNYGVIGHPWNVGSGAQEQNGTYDMMGNVWQWNETPFTYGLSRGTHGGSFGLNCTASDLVSSYRADLDIFCESYEVGFRIASVPEPCTLLLLGLGAAVVKRKR
jgi:sulfatase modifying factor 1